MNTEVKIAGPNDVRVDIEGWLAQVEASKFWFQQRVLSLSIEQLRWRPDLRGWSVAECLDHLNLTIDLYLPKIEEAILSGRRREAPANCSHCDQAETEALKRFEPPVTVAGPAPRATMPQAAIDPDWLVERFHFTRDCYAEKVRESAGINVMQVRILEPVYPAIRTLGGTLALIAAHDRRHMWQAERVIRSPRFPRVAF
jgi:hypothetical protein